MIGIATGDMGIGKDGKPTSNFARGMALLGKQVLLAEVKLKQTKQTNKTNKQTNKTNKQINLPNIINENILKIKRVAEDL